MTDPALDRASTLEERVRHLELYATTHVDSWIVEIYKRLDATDAKVRAILAEPSPEPDGRKGEDEMDLASYCKTVTSFKINGKTFDAAGALDRILIRLRAAEHERNSTNAALTEWMERAANAERDARTWGLQAEVAEAALTALRAQVAEAKSGLRFALRAATNEAELRHTIVEALALLPETGATKEGSEECIQDQSPETTPTDGSPPSPKHPTSSAGPAAPTMSGIASGKVATAHTTTPTTNAEDVNAHGGSKARMPDVTAPAPSTPEPAHRCSGDYCARAKYGIRCADDECDIDSGIFVPPADPQAEAVRGTQWRPMKEAPREAFGRRIIIAYRTHPAKATSAEAEWFGAGFWRFHQGGGDIDDNSPDLLGWMSFPSAAALLAARAAGLPGAGE